MALTINLAGFAQDSIVDGPGLRCTVFCQGCPHGCPGCHNPETHPFTGGVPSATDELFERIRRNPLARGVTLSGGEPFAQADACAELASRCKSSGLEVAAYTGYLFEWLLELGSGAQKDLLAQLDVLVDGPFILAQRDILLKYRGSANQRILNVPASLKAGAAVLETSPRWCGT